MLLQASLTREVPHVEHKRRDCGSERDDLYFGIEQKPVSCMRYAGTGITN